jgi:hypothetical protein
MQEVRHLLHEVRQGSNIFSVISSIFTRKSAKESNDINLLDRAYKEIERLDELVERKDREIKRLREEESNEVKQ